MSKEDIYEFHITGFGPFSGVTHNPTMDLLEFLKSYKPQTEKVKIVSLDVLKVSAIDSLQYLMDTWHRESFSIPTENNNDSKSEQQEPPLKKRKLSAAKSTTITTKNPKELRKMFLHFGVGSKDQKEFRLEKCGWNEANFRVADERQWQPTQQEIRISDGPRTNCLETDLDLESLATTITTKDNFACIVSTDPGRFICNFIYNQSLHLTRNLPNCHSLFVHVPHWETAPKEQQLAFAKVLLDRLCELLVGLPTENVEKTSEQIVTNNTKDVNVENNGKGKNKKQHQHNHGKQRTNPRRKSHHNS